MESRTTTTTEKPREDSSQAGEQAAHEPVSIEATATELANEVQEAAKEVQEPSAKPAKSKVSFWASVKLTIILMAGIATTILLGAWCPQESQVGREKVFEAFGPEMARNLIQWGVADIFHSPWFLFLIAMLTLNMVACSFQRVFPKVRTLKQVMPFLTGREIMRMPVSKRVELSEKCNDELNICVYVADQLRKKGFTVNAQGRSLTAEFGKYGRLAATVTHIGLLTLLAGVTLTSWTGFSGFQPVRLHDTMSMKQSEHSKLWIGQLPSWNVRVDATRRENYSTGEAKQWYSNLSVIDEKGKVLKQGEISVNNPLSYDGVDIYQSSWGMDAVEVSFNKDKKELQLQPMGKRYAAFLPLDQSTTLIFSVLDQSSPLRIFAKRDDWPAPRMITEIKPGETVQLGAVHVKYTQALPVTGLQYKCDPGIPIVYTAFAFIIVGVMMAAIPHRHVWVHATKLAEDKAGCPNSSECPDVKPDGENANVSPEEQDLKNGDAIVLYIGGRSLKAKVAFEKLVDRLAENVQSRAKGDA